MVFPFFHQEPVAGRALVGGGASYLYSRYAKLLNSHATLLPSIFLQSVQISHQSLRVSRREATHVRS